MPIKTDGGRTFGLIRKPPTAELLSASESNGTRNKVGGKRPNVATQPRPGRENRIKLVPGRSFGMPSAVVKFNDSPANAAAILPLTPTTWITLDPST
jgi:hypothetical protein